MVFYTTRQGDVAHIYLPIARFGTLWGDIAMHAMAAFFCECPNFLFFAF